MKIYHDYKMYAAVRYFIFGSKNKFHKRGFRYNSHLYERAKLAYIKLHRIQNSLSHKGMHWWYNGDKTTKSKQCPGEGWILGRMSAKERIIHRKESVLRYKKKKMESLSYRIKCREQAKKYVQTHREKVRIRRKRRWNEIISNPTLYKMHITKRRERERKRYEDETFRDKERKRLKSYYETHPEKRKERSKKGWEAIKARFISDPAFYLEYRRKQRERRKKKLLSLGKSYHERVKRRKTRF